MAKKMNSLAGDLEGISKGADSKVLALLHETKGKADSPKSESQVAISKTGASKKEFDSPDTVSSRIADSKSASAKAKVQKRKELDSWEKPDCGFNTRIPKQMNELIDDLVYKLRKKGTAKTKQELALEAFHDLLRKHSIF